MLRLLLIALWASQALATNILLLILEDPHRSDFRPLYQALKAHPSVIFECVIIPSNLTSTPSTEVTYLSKELRKYQNAALLGFVQTDEGGRTASQIQQDVAAYAAWPADIAPSGIFFSKVDGEKEAKILQPIAEDTRKKLGGNKSPQDAARIIFSPRVVPTSKDNGDIMYASADRVVIFEKEYFKLPAQQEAIAAEIKARGAKKIGILITRVPKDKTDNLTTKYVTEMGGVGSLYISNLDSFTPPGFGSDLSDFVNSVAQHAHM